MMQDINDLKELCKSWNSPCDWRVNCGMPEFGLKCSGGMIEWFPYYRAPERIEKLVVKWMRLGGDQCS